MACSISNKQKRKVFCQKTSLSLFQALLPLAKGWYDVAAPSTRQAEWVDRAPTGQQWRRNRNGNAQLLAGDHHTRSRCQGHLPRANGWTESRSSPEQAVEAESLPPAR